MVLYKIFNNSRRNIYPIFYRCVYFFDLMHVYESCAHVLIGLESSILSILELTQESLILVTIITAELGWFCGFV